MRQLPGRSPKNCRGSSRNFRGSPGPFPEARRKPDSLPATRQNLSPRVNWYQKYMTVTLHRLRGVNWSAVIACPPSVWEFQRNCVSLHNCFRVTGIGIIEKGVPQAYVRARASSATPCLGARVKGLSLYFLDQKGNLIRIKTGLDTYLIRIQTRTPLSRYHPPYDYCNRN